MNSLDDILAEARSLTKKAKKPPSEPSLIPKAPSNARYPYAPYREPDALVLCIITAKCTNCRSEYAYPSRTLLTRFGGFMPRFEGPLSYLHDSPDHKKLRREIENFSEETPFCQECFEADGTYQDEEYKRPSPLSPIYTADDDRPPHPLVGTNPASVIKTGRGAPMTDTQKALLKDRLGESNG